ncbi:MAG: class I SAM-dependent methyltransferase [Elusimicrobia bacterium]|nr:class I SAM-dependent methyltransferase [Elusimicrobiota bacterium]
MKNSETNKLSSWLDGLNRGEMMAQFIMRETGLLKNKNILDIGAGGGGISIAFAKHCLKVTAVEPSDEYAGIIRERIKNGNVNNISLIQEPFLSARLAENSFDLILLNGVLEWTAINEAGDFENVHQRVLSRAFSLLKNGGVLYLGIENRWFPLNLLWDPHVSLPFVCMLPRKIADFVSYLLAGRLYKTPIYSYRKLKGMVGSAGFAGSTVYMPVINYQYPCGVINIEEKGYACDRQNAGIYAKYKNLNIDAHPDIKLFYIKTILALKLAKLLAKSFIVLAYKNS